MMSAMSVDTGVSTGVRTPVLRRVAQAVLDRLLILGLSLTVVALLVALALLAIRLGAPVWVVRIPPFVVIPAMVLGYVWTDLWMPHRRGGATPAMRLLGLRIVREYDGGQPALRDLVIRLLLTSVDGLFFGLLGVLLIAVTERHQRVGDLVAHTLVIRVR